MAYRDERDGDLLPTSEILRWFNTEEGKVWKFWASLRQEQPDTTEEEAEQILRAINAQEQAALDLAEKKLQGLPEGNSGGQAQQQTAESQSQSPGDKSSAT